MPATRSILNQVEDILLAPARLGTMTPLKILIVGPEVSPYANVGGVSRVLAHLAKALVKKGHDARVFMPKFGLIDEEKYELKMVYEGLKVPTGDEKKPELVCNVKMHQAAGHAPVYFLENQEYYELRANVYGYNDDPIRWVLLSRGVLEFLRQQKGDGRRPPDLQSAFADRKSATAEAPTLRRGEGWRPDIIHTNDWQIGALPNFLRTTYVKDEKLLKLATLFTIHNLSYQGMFDHKNVTELNFDDGRSAIAPLFSERLSWQNFMRRGIMYADIVNTVSKTYAKEILKEEFGEGLNKLLTEVRAKLFGIVNGIDFEDFNPATDKLIAENFDVYSLEKRRENKLALQEEFDLQVDEKIPLLGHVGRLEMQKGLDLTAEVLRPLLRDFDVQFVAVGGGDGEIANMFRELQKEFPEKVGTHLMLDFNLSHLVFAGADIMVFPSRFEPCGIVQMEAMRYGAIPIVRATGGLADTVTDFNPETDTGFGFVFRDFDAWAFFAQIVRALEIYRHKDTWEVLIKRAMTQDNSWEARADDYIKLYRKAIHLRTEQLIDEGEIERPAAEIE
ncbi:MAG: glycogen synthase [Candidatus Cloacimonetes bacterium]|nr:glycogen synthase [Candidatus Cloacimonadota bacterium]